LKAWLARTPDDALPAARFLREEVERSIIASGYLPNQLLQIQSALFRVIPVKERAVLKAMRAQTEEGIVRTAIALERYRLAHHPYPVTLRDLVPALLHEVPIDCMDGHDLRYRLNPDGSYLLYSVGNDGVDNGGDPTPVAGRNLGFLNGQDWVWPRPATDGEVQAYEAEQNKPKAWIKRP